MKIVFCWSMISGYMAACWQSMAQRTGVDLFVLAHGKSSAVESSAGFSSRLLDGIPHQLLDEHEAKDCELIETIVRDHRPDIVAFTGWWLRPYRQLMYAKDLQRAKFIMGVDSPWRHETQFLTALRHWRTLTRVDHVFVTGERSWQYVRRVGVPISRISRGMYGVDVQGWSRCLAERKKTQWPRQFLFMGRYAREKAIDVLVEAYSLYRTMVRDPWSLACCGRGSLASLLRGCPGVTDHGFVEPCNLTPILVESGAYVMPSRYDPWPLALVEAAAAGLPIICTDACGSAVEVVRDAYNGFVIPSESPSSLARAMVDLSMRYDALPQWGQRSQELAACYSTELWADRWLMQIDRLVTPPPAKEA